MNKVNKSIRNIEGRITAKGYRIVHGDHYVADVYGNMAEELTQLFAAAPEMLDALKAVAVTDALHGMKTGGMDIMSLVANAIAKAEGRPE